MTLEEKIRPHAQYWDCYNDCSLDENHTDKLIKIADEFAIGFGEWLEILSNADYGTSEYDTYQKWDVTTLLEIYKKEKQL